jgi:hypothetical protein
MYYEFVLMNAHTFSSCTLKLLGEHARADDCLKPLNILINSNQLKIQVIISH